MALAIQMRKRGAESEDATARKPETRSAAARSAGAISEARSSEARNLSSANPKNRCPGCNNKGEYYKEYDDHYCRECEEYFGI